MGMAAHLEGKGVLVLDMAGLAQKGGAVMSHVRLATTPAALHAARVPAGQADLLLGCDLLVASGPEAGLMLNQQRTQALINTDVAPTGAFTTDPDWHVSPAALQQRVAQAVQGLLAIDASTLATALMGDAVAWQKGWVPLSEAALRRAIELNGAAVAMNLAAFAWGRQAAIDPLPLRVAAGLAAPPAVVMLPERTPPLDALLADRVQRLTDYQNAAYAGRYEAFVRRVAHEEQQRVGVDTIARAVAVSLYHLMAYKDEYEVARLHSDPAFGERLAAQFEGPVRLVYHLAPPLLSRPDGQGRPIKRSFGPWMGTVMRLLAHGRHLRGSWLDPFGHTAERRAERVAITDYLALMTAVMAGLTPAQHATALALARLPQSVKGFGPVKARQAQGVRLQQEALLRTLRQTGCPTEAV
ncbi:MAG: indolepyruvate ferredoxin oxidoreductase, partial [Burkholderiales bacterium PBB5]